MNALRLATRRLTRAPTFSVVVALTLAFGIGASTLIFSVVHALLLEPLPYPQSDRIVRLVQLDERGRRANPSDPNFQDLKEQTRVFSALAQYNSSIESVAGGSEPVRVVVADVSRDFNAVLGVEPILGRRFVDEELHAGAAPVALISDAYWQRYLGRRADFASHTLRIGDRMHAIVGVMPPGFDYPDGAAVWTPRELWPVSGRTAHNYRALGRLARDVSLGQARDDLAAIARALKIEHGDDTWMVDVALVPLRDQLLGNIRPALYVLGAGALLLLVVACANALSLLLVRAVAREEELAVRIALGASRRPLLAQFFAEALVLSGAGAALGVLLAWWGVQLLGALDPGVLPRAEGIKVDQLSVAFAATVALTVAAGLSLLVVLHAPQDAARLRTSERAVSGSGSWLRDGLVALQVAIALVLIVGATLLGRSFMQLSAVDPGFRADGTILMNLSTTWPGEDTDRRLRLVAFYDQLFDRLRVVPGIETVGGINAPPLRGGQASGRYVVQQHRDEITDFEVWEVLSNDPTRTGEAEYRVASEEYFRTLRIPLLHGRTFARSDAPDTEHVAVVSRSLAEAQWPGEDPLGKLIQFGNMDGDLTPFTIVGVVGDVHEYGLDSAPRPTFYAYYRQRQWHIASFWIALRAPHPEGLIPQAREIVHALDPDLPPEFITGEALFSDSIARPRFSLVMLALFGGAALALALAGLYGAIAFHVARRTHEIGVRIALGARAASVVAMVVRRSLALAGAGVAAGLVVALATVRLLESLLYGVPPYDAATFAAGAVALLVLAAAAAWWPAIRASRVDPVAALRSQ